MRGGEALHCQQRVWSRAELGMGAQRGGGLSSAPGNARPPLCPYKACGGPRAWGRAALATLRGGQALRCGSRPGGHAHLRAGPRCPTAAPDAPHGLGRAATTAPRGTARFGLSPFPQVASNLPGRPAARSPPVPSVRAPARRRPRGSRRRQGDARGARRFRPRPRGGGERGRK